MRRWLISTVGLMALASGAVALQAAPALAQTLGQGSDDDVPWGRLIGAMLLCIALAVGAAFVLRGRMNGPLAAMLSRGAAPRRIRVVETTRLTHQVDVCLLELDGEEILLAVSAQGASVLRPDKSPRQRKAAS